MITIINIGDILILEPKYSDKLERYKCRIVEKNGENLYIDYPINLETNKSAFLLDGTQLKSTFVYKESSTYMFDTEIVGRVKQKIPMMILSYPGDEQLIKIQRRQYVRIETSVDVAIHPINNEFIPFTSVTDDISAGGMAFVTNRNKDLKREMLLKVHLVLPMQNGEYHYINLKSKIIRMDFINEERMKVSIQFIEITPQERQLMLRFSFDRQLEIKKKGLEY